MIYIDSFHFPTANEINNYMNIYNYTPYPWNLFLYNGLEWIICKDITIFAKMMTTVTLILIY